MNVISVICPPNPQLHLAPYEAGLGASVFTLCLERWSKREECREGSTFCPECLEKWNDVHLARALRQPAAGENQ